jgi:hypothetical protein
MRGGYRLRFAGYTAPFFWGSENSEAILSAGNHSLENDLRAIYCPALSLNRQSCRLNPFGC